MTLARFYFNGKLNKILVVFKQLIEIKNIFILLKNTRIKKYLHKKIPPKAQ